MNDEVYEQLADALNRLPNAFPRTPSNIEIPMLQKIFFEDEAALACHLTGTMETADVIAERTGLEIDGVKKRLIALVKRGFVWLSKEEGKLRFRLAPFIVGIFEAQLESMDHEFVHLYEEYMADGGAVGIMKPQPAIHRVVPAKGAVKTEWILPYDDVRALFIAAKTFSVRDCICRVQQDLLGQRKCDFPLKNCLSFSSIDRPSRPGDITKEQALAILDKTEDLGLVHTVSNVIKGIFYVCNCCGCCCGILRGITEWGIEESVAAANYFAVIDPDECTECGICIERCQVHAISEKDGKTVAERKKCIGCGLCVTGCPNDAVRLQKKPDAEIIHPPDDFAAWERERLQNRGLEKRGDKI
ncbi:MAG: 4Fe-4S dicluster domain-containing protein [Candidatus Stahlbacteria bacterium]|nr:MAG: 4Fe-4S dicluster domain-containing protein [Candidatus Stahlbacteria bacterium]